MLTENKEIVAAFALCESDAGADAVYWDNKAARALYIDRFGVNVKYARKGIGGEMLHKAIALAKEKGAEYLRLFVVDCNEPAIRLYKKYGFQMADGIYEQKIDEDLILHEFAFEIEIP